MSTQPQDSGGKISRRMKRILDYFIWHGLHVSPSSPSFPYLERATAQVTRVAYAWLDRQALLRETHNACEPLQRPRCGVPEGDVFLGGQLHPYQVSDHLARALRRVGEEAGEGDRQGPGYPGDRVRARRRPSAIRTAASPKLATIACEEHTHGHRPTPSCSAFTRVGREQAACWWF